MGRNIMATARPAGPVRIPRRRHQGTEAEAIAVLESAGTSERRHLSLCRIVYRGVDAGAITAPIAALKTRCVVQRMGDSAEQKQRGRLSTQHTTENASHPRAFSHALLLSSSALVHVALSPHQQSDHGR